MYCQFESQPAICFNEASNQSVSTASNVVGVDATKVVNDVDVTVKDESL